MAAPAACAKNHDYQPAGHVAPGQNLRLVPLPQTILAAGAACCVQFQGAHRGTAPMQREREVPGPSQGYACGDRREGQAWQTDPDAGEGRTGHDCQSQGKRARRSQENG